MINIPKQGVWVVCVADGMWVTLCGWRSVGDDVWVTDVAEKVSWFRTIRCVSNIWLVSTNTWWWLGKNMLYQQKIWQVSEMSWFSKKYAVSAKKTCWVIKMPDDNSTKDSWVSKDVLSQQKSADLAKYAVSTSMTSCLMLLLLATKLHCVSKNLQVSK